MLSKAELVTLIFSIVLAIAIVIMGLMHSSYFDKQPKKGNAHKISQRCVSAECMEAAAWLMGNLDDSVPACENFYDRACGNYAKQHPMRSEETETSVLSNMKEKNKIRLQEIISSTPVRSQWGHMYEVAKMVNNYYQACINQYERSKRYMDHNNPLIPILHKQLGVSWWVSDPSEIAQFDWQAAMRAMARDRNFVFFRLNPLPKENDLSKNLLEVMHDTSPTFHWRNQIGRSRSKTRTFNNFVKALGQMLARDNGSNTSSPDVSQRINQFADDVVNVTATLSTPVIYAQLFGRSDRHHRVYNYTAFRNQPGNNFIDWSSLVSSFTDNKFRLRSRTPIVEHVHIKSIGYSYSSKMSQALRDFNRNDRDFNRKMNNYMAFRIALYWMIDLNYEYNHLYLMYLALFHGRTQYQDDWEICMDYADFAMPKTLGALYVAKFYKTSEESTVNDIGERVRTTLWAEIPKLSWMDGNTKTAALKKLQKIVFKIGKPKTWVNDDAIANEMASTYGSVSISSKDHFANIRALMEVLRKEEVRQLTVGSNAYDHWRTELYDTHIEYYARWNELLIPAGLLQEPIVSPTYPAYLNFGGLGSWIASSLINAIDEDGQVYDANYAEINWWSPKTWENYTPLKQNVIDYYEEISPSIIKRHVNTTSYAPFAIAETGGLRVAYTAYKQYSSNKSVNELALPSLAHGNTDQLFFYSYASTHCADYTSHTYAWRTIFGQVMPEFIHVNGGVSLLPEFRQAFQCPIGSSMITPEVDRVQQIF